MSDRDSDNAAELKAKLRDAESKTRLAESALAEVKSGRLRVALGSAAAGFLLFVVGGQWFPGYQLDSTARATSSQVAASAVSEVMAELCAERFMSMSGLEARLAALEEASGDWSKASYIRDGTWATTPAGEKTDHATADRCRGLIAERLSASPQKTSS